MKAQLTPNDFRADLTDGDIVEIGFDEKAQRLDEALRQTYDWGYALIAKGIDPAVMYHPNFDPNAYGIG